jgi:hypothetical protein
MAETPSQEVKKNGGIMVPKSESIKERLLPVKPTSRILALTYG